MKKLVSIILVFALLVSVAVYPHAEDGYTVTPSNSVTVMVNGQEISESTLVTGTDIIKLVASDENAVVAGVEGVYYPLNEEFSVTCDADFSNAVTLGTGLEMVDGAQVRVGQVQLEEGGKLDALSDSGLRFIATANYTDTIIADENVEFGIKVMAEESSTPAYVKAEKFQKEDRSVFSAAITKLNESNYNRKYTACAYALVPMHDGTEKEITVGAVTRSIYQVSVGILKNSSADYNEGLPYTIDDAVKEILGAYVNQTGIRLTYTADGEMSARVSGSGAYTGDLFFNVTSSVNSDGSTAVTVTPLGETEGFFNPVTIASWWKEYIRINNNNSVASQYIHDAKLENGILSFTFRLPGTAAYTFNQEDNVTIVSSVTSKQIKGFKAGEEVTYDLAEVITVLGLATTMADVVPGSVIMVGTNSDGDVAAVELLASLGLPINPEGFVADFGVYDASDGSTKYKNIVTEMFSKSGSRLTCQNLPDTTKTTYKFVSTSAMCYRVGIAMDGDTPVITATGSKISTYPSIFESTAQYHNYLYLRYDSETEKVKECVFYCVPKNLDFSGDGEYSDIFSLDDYRVIIE
ncbi:MAG: hypothetical protein IJ316_01645 [Clostridia bacterium]|nr:hypothetical protein [Clostridia bacterium]